MWFVAPVAAGLRLGHRLTLLASEVFSVAGQGARGVLVVSNQSLYKERWEVVHDNLRREILEGKRHLGSIFDVLFGG